MHLADQDISKTKTRHRASGPAIQLGNDMTGSSQMPSAEEVSDQTGVS